MLLPFEIQYKKCYCVFLAVYAAVTIGLFHLVYQTSKLVIDEEFHLIQGEHYCHGRFHIWNNKITTFPGLYLIAAAFLGPFRACSVYALRWTSVIASITNACLIFVIRNRAVANKRKGVHVLLESMSLSTLPPLYFFSHLYYTDVLSVTMVLMMLYFNLRNMHNWGAMAAFLAILMRQTNVVWVSFIFGGQVISRVQHQTLAGRNHKRHEKNTFKEFCNTIQLLLRSPRSTFEIIKPLMLRFLGYELNILVFLTFLYLNKSIVIGDKSAHVATIHLPQMFYFSLFFALFSSSLILGNLQRVLQFTYKRWYCSALCIIVFTIIVIVNTNVHPYLLADNRHYTFYIWNRFYGRWWFAKLLPIPVYYWVLVLLGFILFSNQSDQMIGYSIMWLLATTVSIALQQLIEVRYFILSFLVLRLIQNSVPTTTKLLVLEVIVNVIVNIVAFYVFFTKEFYWSEYDDPQRVIW